MQLPLPPTSPGNGASTGDTFDEHNPAKNAANLRSFVIEVLKCSRIPTSVLQSALCLIETVRAKISELASAKAAGCGYRETDQSDRIVFAADISYDKEDTKDAGTLPSPTHSTPTTPPPDLPLPLLDPRHMFIAALVLTIKFSQGKCYSNRAWAKLVELLPCETGRCEHALGDALGWRLWVGKALV